MSNKQPNLLVKLFRFFFPKDFMGELRRGKEMGKTMGKAARMKIGKQRRRKK